VGVGRAQKVLDGVRHYFSFGWINAGSVSDTALIEVDFTGVLKKYRTIRGFGSGNHSYYAIEMGSICVPVMPWEA
jgi:hypothetical protein